MPGSESNFINHALFKEIGLFFVEFCQGEHWQVVTNTIYQALFGNLFVTSLVMFGLLLGLMLYQRLIWFADRTIKRANRDETISSRQVAKLFLSSALACILAWTPLFLFGAGLIFKAHATANPDFQFSLGMGLVVVSMVGVVFRVSQELLSNGGLSEALYGFKYTNARYILNQIELTVFLATPLLFLIAFASVFQQGRWQDSLGRFSFLLLLLVAFSQFHRLFWPESKLYQRLRNDSATAESAWMRHRVMIYLMGLTVFFLITGLTLSGWMLAAKAISINVALTALVGMALFALRTILKKRADEMIRRLNLIGELGRSTDSPATAKSPLVKDFVSRNSQTAYQGIDFLGTISFFAVAAFIWRNWIQLPPEWLEIEFAGLALSGVSTAVQLLVIGFMTYYCAKELPGFLIWCFSHQTGLEIRNSKLASRIMGAMIVYVGLWCCLIVMKIEFPAIPWLGTLLVASILFSIRNFLTDAAAGIMILLDSRIVPGDCIEVDGHLGRVDTVNWLSTEIEDNLGTRCVVPNSKLIGQNVVKTRESQTMPLVVEVALPKQADAYQAQAIMMMVAERDPAILTEPPPHVRFTGFRLNEIRFEIRMLVQSNTNLANTRKRIEDKLAIEFDRHEIEKPPTSVRHREPSFAFTDGLLE